MIARTSENLALFCLQVVGAPYWFGCFGQKANAQLFNEKKAQYPSNYNSWDKSTFTDDYGKRVTDCAGLIKWFLWANNMTDKAPTYKSSEDYGANGFWNKCKEKGKIATLPANKVGILVFKGTDAQKTHVGVIVDNDGTVVEAKGHMYGTVKSKASQWGYWGKCHLITYTTTPAPEPAPVIFPKTYTVKVNSFLSMRAAPSVSAPEKGRLFNGAVVTITETANGWGKISSNLWVSMSYLTPS